MPRSSRRAHSHIRSSRRVAPLTDREIDHEIALVDREENGDLNSMKSLSRSESQASLTRHANGHASDDGNASIDEGRAGEAGPSRAPVIVEHPSDEEANSGNTNHSSSGAHDSNERVRDSGRKSRDRTHSQPRPKSPESEIDILYENQRGGFLCGIPLFSSAALGNLDPPAWTNFAHKPSPTNPQNAQVPDPSWEWAWPEWRINHDDSIEADNDGWEYSFMFSKKFSWHGPKWYNSFVRRRAWIRRRVKTGKGYLAMDDQAMNPAYFNVSAKTQDRGSFGTVEEMDRISTDRLSWASPRRSQSRPRGEGEEPATTIVIKTGEELVKYLRHVRVDRERLEGIENYIEHCTDDLLPLQDYMHEIMAMFVFQTTRQKLLSRLTQLYDEVTGDAPKGKSTKTPKGENLAEAIKHADEEVRRLEYWSDIKGMAESGEAVRAVDEQKGWDAGWQGLDKSGAKGINEDKIP
ncbi:hypothetical protein F5Y17DRAFT_433125 [Xylariaceae sp. FL0594]|nr:hypothetical protein F5Y17DRAFT_433125 [Xylariaceae sp. FL0594]